MFLSKLQILGFKSFPQKIELHFDRGMTAIVGPNGCGKTNLLDAIRWVLGEQRTTILRSSKMEDVIFNGTKDLKPLGMAEVTLGIENSKGILPIDYSLVTVTRRLFRSGESEYLLNKNPCRLKDITELFLDTGVGTHAYSVIQPEMVEAILSDKAEERRFLFEEAAGITKYKVRRREAERKLEHTENDLLRLGDILGEVEKQVNGLRRQKGKAERYKRLSEEVKDLEIRLSQHEHRALKAKQGELEARLQISADESEKTGTDLSKEEAKVESLKLKLLETEKEVGSLGRKISELSEKGFQIEREISVSRERKSNLEKLIERNRQEMENLTSRHSSVEKEREDKAKQLNQIAGEIDSKKKACEAEELAVLGADEGLHRMKERLRQLAQEWQETSDDLNRQQNERLNAEAQLEELKQRDTKLAEETEALDHKIDDISQTLTKLSSQNQQRKKSLELKRDQMRVLKERAEQNQSDLAELMSEEGKNRSLLEREKTRLQMLKQISEHYEGYGRGERWVMSAQKRLPGIIGTVADLMTAEVQYVTAIESALGEAAQFIVCKDTECAKSAVERLKAEKAGRATFLPLDKMRNIHVSSAEVDLDRHKGIIGKASRLVRRGPELEKITDMLLGNVIMVETLSDAVRLSPQLPPGLDLVTLEGEMVTSQGALSGGSPKEVTLLGRELEINRLEEKVAELGQSLDRIESDKREKESQAQQLSESVSQITSQMQEISDQVQQSEVELKTLEFERNSLAERKNDLEELRRNTQAKISELEPQAAAQGLRIRELENQKHKLSSAREEERLALEKAESSHTETFRKANQLKIELVSLQGKEEQIRSDQSRLSELIDEIRGAQEARRKESENALTEIESIVHLSGEREKELREVFQSIEQEKSSLNSKTEEQVRGQEELSMKERGLKTSREAREKSLDVLHQLKMQQLEVSSQARTIRDRIFEDFLHDLDKMEASGDFDANQIQSWRERLHTLKEKLRSIGVVNLLALEEYETSKQRLDFLQNQVKDLTEAKETLTSTIAKINNTARTLFIDTFEQIKLNFQQVFGELFEGGETELSLIESSDPLESPIQISARPYGKRLLSISQLSGGEKALTAIALLFAIYLVKPSPFCIFDEVDAPLDDPNTARFLKLIKHFSSGTQFIIITHNKLTMEAADILYGVTMEQPGVSKIVSVRFDKYEVATG